MHQQHNYNATLISLRIAAIIGLSSLLGLTFNASNPLGVRFGQPLPGMSAVQDEQSPKPPSAAAEPARKSTQPLAETPPALASSAVQNLGVVTSPSPTLVPQVPVPATNGPSFTPPSPTTWAQVKPKEPCKNYFRTKKRIHNIIRNYSNPAVPLGMTRNA